MNNTKALDLEVSLILARIYKNLKLKSGMSTDILDISFSKLDMTFYPYLALLGSQGPKGITKKIRTLAVFSQIMYLSTEIHNRIPEDSTNLEFTNKVQLPILVGDLLYSKFYEILCTEDCFEYLDYYTEYVTQLNLNWIDYLQHKVSIEDISSCWYGELASMIMELTARTSGFNGYWVKVIKRYGFGLGNLFGVYKLGLSAHEINKSWNTVQEAINLMPPGEIKDNLSSFAQNIYNSLFQNIVLDEFILSAAAER
ncbi:MAG: hypothetical protein JM58_00520 [Peptococcaceae bacterium BICA1-8]|nr:MAG: hypothetical protein JM58_00520 [Peptococcaceae bacterium BICA1-8]